MIKRVLAIAISFFSPVLVGAQTLEVSSQDKNIILNVNLENGLSWSVKTGQKMIIDRVDIGLDLGEKVLGKNPQLISDKIVKKKEEIFSVVPQKNRKITNVYNELQLKFKGDYAVHFRVYNEGVAYRFLTSMKGDIEVHTEKMEVHFPEATTSLFPQEENMYSHYERAYLDKKLEEISAGDFCSLPVLFDVKEGIKILFSEADLYDYPNMFLEGTGTATLKAIFPKVVLETKPLSSRADRSELITKEADYIARTSGYRSFPWRFFVISQNDKVFLEQDMVFKLSRSLALESTDWIRPGKVAWDWYNANNIYNVDFETGLNTATYKYYIDFAARYGLEYVILDEGWTKSTTEILEFNPEINVHKLIAYGKEKGVGIILWCLWKPLDANMEQILQTYSDWGAKGVKVDFMQRADQYMVNSYMRIAQEAAKRKLLVNFHGAYKPAGLRRAYPNVLSYEGVRGNENNKWASYITPDHNLIIPFIRMAVGPMDFTPGAMRNAQEGNHHISYNRPMSLGTRAHQAAMYVVFESALQMLCDSPSSYLKDKNTVEVISRIPSVWDESRALHAKIGEYVAMARRYEDNWYIGAMTNWEKRSLPLDFSFLQQGEYEMTILKDGVNANKYAEDYKVEKIMVTPQTKMEIHLAKGGGWVAILEKKP